MRVIGKNAVGAPKRQQSSISAGQGKFITVDIVRVVGPKNQPIPHANVQAGPHTPATVTSVPRKAHTPSRAKKLPRQLTEGTPVSSSVISTKSSTSTSLGSRPERRRERRGRPSSSDVRRFGGEKYNDQRRTAADLGFQESN